MANTDTVKVAIGMVTSHFYPITAEPASAHPTYGPAVHMGAAVKGYLSITTSHAEVRGDDMALVDSDSFVSGQLDAETTLDDLETNAIIFGHQYTAEDGETSTSVDQPKAGGYSFIQRLMKQDKSIVCRATCLYKVSAIANTEKQEADTKPAGDLTVKNNAISYKIMEDNINSWRRRKEFATQQEAEAFIASVFAGQK